MKRRSINKNMGVAFTILFLCVFCTSAVTEIIDEPGSHTITFDANGGTMESRTMESQTMAEGSSADLMANPYIRSGYSFTGWAISENAASAVYADQSSYTMGTADVKLYAVWIWNAPTLSELQKGGYITMIDVHGVMDGSYKQATSTTTGFVHNISAFSLGKFEVTYELWYTVYRWALSNGYAFANAGFEGKGATPGTVPTIAAMHEPVTTVNWRDCIVWCNAYSEMAGKIPVYYSDSAYLFPIRSSVDYSYGSSVNTKSGSADNPYINMSSKGYRLPTEGEWMYAASCKSVYPYDYASGADAPYDATSGIVDIDGDGDVQYSGDVAWYTSNSSVTTRTVGTKAANVWGFCDLSGNVCEWCQDWFGTLPTAAQANYKGASSGLYRILRGGSWLYLSRYLQVGSRNYYDPYYGGSYFGFRVCCGR